MIGNQAADLLKKDGCRKGWNGTGVDQSYLDKLVVWGWQDWGSRGNLEEREACKRGEQDTRQLSGQKPSSSVSSGMAESQLVDPLSGCIEGRFCFVSFLKT